MYQCVKTAGKEKADSQDSIHLEMVRWNSDTEMKAQTELHTVGVPC